MKTIFERRDVDQKKVLWNFERPEGWEELS
jgi:hypothetical protein